MVSLWALIGILIKILVVVGITQGAVAYLILVERKVAAYTQDRIGPNRAGPFALLQPLADGAKMLLKEDVIPKYVSRPLYLLAPWIAITTAMKAISSPRGANSGYWFRIAPSRAPSVAPPNAPDMMPISVMPTCTPDRNRPGFSASASARCAPRLPASAICCRRMRREDTIASSAIAKNPFRRVSATTMAISSQTVIACRMWHAAADAAMSLAALILSVGRSRLGEW